MWNQMRALVVAALMFVGATAIVRAQDFRQIGSFDNVRASQSEDPHCYGHSLTLWAHGNRVIGLLDVHGGLCGDPPCTVLSDVSFQRGTGRLSFSAVIDTQLRFEGTLRRDDVLGRLNGTRVRLERERDVITLESDRSLAAWCRFWTAVGRCRGVRELCATLGQS